MSELHDLHVLIIEDDPTMLDRYRARARRMGLANLAIAESLEQAERCLSTATHLDLVILDLCIPEAPGLPAGDAIELGKELLEQCVKRDDKPIPSVLIITALLGKTEQTKLRERLDMEFDCGRLVLKTDYFALNDEIERALERVRAFRQKQTSGEQVCGRAQYLVNRLAMKLDVPGFHLARPTSDDLRSLEGSPLTASEANVLIGTPVGTKHRYCMVLMTADRDRLDSVFLSAKHWAKTSAWCPSMDWFRGNDTALFYFPIVQGRVEPSSEEALPSEVTQGAIDAQVCDLVFACMHGQIDISTLISGLAQFDQAFKELDEEFVQEVLERARRRQARWAPVATLALRVGAFDAKANTEQDSETRRHRANAFRQNYANHRPRGG